MSLLGARGQYDQSARVHRFSLLRFLHQVFVFFYALQRSIALPEIDL